ncbi:MAG TPA: hypothetical protein VF077_08780 [Nitrospiraceae bacterium]
MKAIVTSATGALRRVLAVDQQGYARADKMPMERELYYEERTTAWSDAGAGTYIFQTPQMWLDGRTAVRLEMYLSNCRPHVTGAADLQWVFTDNFAGVGTSFGSCARYFWLGSCGPIMAWGTFNSAGQFPVRGMHSFDVAGVGNGASVTVVGMAPTYFRVTAMRLLP